MAQLKTISLNYFLSSLGLAENPSYESCFIKELQFFKESRKFLLKIIGKEILQYQELESSLDKLKRALRKNLNSHIKIDFSYKIQYSSLEDLVDMNWQSILYILQKNVPSFKSIENSMEKSIKESQLTLIFHSNIIAKKVRERKVEGQIEKYFLDLFHIDIGCNIHTDGREDFNLKLYEKKKERENQALINEINRQNLNRNSSEKNSARTRLDRTSSSNILLGRNFSGEVSKILDLSLDSGKVIIEGEIISLEIKQLSSGKELAILNVTDYTNSITAKIFEKRGQKTQFKNILAEGMAIRAQGHVAYDNFIKENVIMLDNIMKVEKSERKDLQEEKRVELHLHTQMSAMDGISTISDFISQAAKWGHKAIALTDHGVVQAFPEAMEASKQHGLKVIYGLEGYLVNDDLQLVEGEDNYPLRGEFVVLDLETTGLYSKTDKITEIGAIKIRDGQIIDTYSSLVNPQIDIPDKITQLTGIDNDMVRDQPSIDLVLPEFFKFVGRSPLVAHNSDFDLAFIREGAANNNINFTNTVVDTLKLARVLLPDLKRHRLNLVARELNVPLLNHHRALDDARATAEIFIKFIEIMEEMGIMDLGDINKHLVGKTDFKKLKSYHIVILAKNRLGLENLYRLVSESHINYFYKRPRIPRSLLNKHREGLILGTACEAGELFQAILSNKTMEEIEAIAAYYDYLEIQPIDNNIFLVEKGAVRDRKALEAINKTIVELGDRLEKPVVATGDVHFLEPRDSIFRQILMTGQGFEDSDKQMPLYFKTTDEMLEDFSYLGEKKSIEVVIENPNKICSQVEDLIPIPEGTFSPEIEGSEEELRNMCYNKARDIYGDKMPAIVQDRLDKELNSIISNGYAVMYIIAHKLVAKSLEDGYLVGSRGSVGSSLAATMSDITEVNPLPPHYICSKCKYSSFILDGSYGSGVDLPDENCPKCGQALDKEGHDIPFEVFLGFEGDKEPDIDLNFAGEYQGEAHKYTEELFGKGKVFRAGTIGTIADKTAYGFVRKYIENKELNYNMAEINRLTKGCTGVKRTSGQHPGGVIIVPSDYDIYKFTPIQYPANDPKSGVITTHFDFNAIEGKLLKLDILGHDVPSIIKMLEDLTGLRAQDIPLDDQATMDIFTSTAPLGIEPDDIGCQVGSLGIPEFGTKFVRQMLIDTQPRTFAELVRISGLSHGTDVWLNNAQDLVRNNVAQLKDVISTRDDIMNYLILRGLSPKRSFTIMENVRRGRGLREEDEEEMRKCNVPQWYIDSCNKIKYMFPKAHAVAYVMMSFRIAYFKVHYPEAFYASYFTTKAEDFDAHLIIRGKEAIRNKIKELEALANEATAKERNYLTVLEVALEMYSRGIEILNVDLYNSQADKFTIVDGKLLPPLMGLEGLGQNAAKNIVEARKEGEFISIEDLRKRTRVTKTVIEALSCHGCIENLPETNQLSLFSLA